MEGSASYDTYYVYDSYRNLRAVLPPLASDHLSGNTAAPLTETNSYLMQYAFLYKYDERNRCIARKMPGAEWIHYIYDKADQLIFIQDGNQRAKLPQEWTFNISDMQGRVVLTGTTTNIPDVAAVNNTVVFASYPQTGSGIYWGYNISGVSLTGNYTILSASYYDHYRFRMLTGFSNSSFEYENSGIESVYLTRYGTDSSVCEHKGLLTGTVFAKMTASSSVSYLYSVMYYDDCGRVIQAKSTNHLPDGLEKMYIAYNFTGQPVKSRHIHSATGKITQTEEYTYTYDHARRLLTTKHKLNSGTEVILAQNTYDNLGRLSTVEPIYICW